MNFYDAIFVRKSVKNYYMEQLDQSMLDHILNFAAHITPIMSNTKFEYKIIDNTKVENHLSGIFSVKAPYYFVISSESKDDDLLNAGYIMEQIALYLTIKGLGSCFVSAKKPRKEEVLGLHYEHIVMLAFGKTKDNKFLNMKKLNRSSESNMCIYKEEVDNNMKLLIKAALSVPSSYMNQTWKFVVYENRIHVFCNKDLSFAKGYEKGHELKYFDTGIMLSHIVIAAEELWLDTSIKRLDNISNKYFKNYEYIISVLIK